MHHRPNQSALRYPLFIFILSNLVSCIPSFAQKKYTIADSVKIQRNRISAAKAFEDWDRKKLYQLGIYFESIYDKYKDSSMNMAISCYTIAASSESEYLNYKEGFSAASRLGKIFESGKGTHIDLHKAMVFYYLSDDKIKTTYNKLGESKNSNFQRINKKYCPRDIASVQGKAGRIDSVVIEYSPFCRQLGNTADLAIEKLVDFLKSHPEKLVSIRISGDKSIPAAQYTMKVQNFVVPELYRMLVNELVEKEGISADRIEPFNNEMENGKYQAILTVK